MKRLFQALAAIVTLWVLGSFVGVMFDTANQNLWTRSLMWSMLASIILAPVFIFVGTAPSGSSSQSASNPSRAEQSFDVDEKVEVSQEEDTSEKQGWPYTS
jgi:type VI protein secretion system component VasK